jgi:hypothetical protein
VGSTIDEPIAATRVWKATDTNRFSLDCVGVPFDKTLVNCISNCVWKGVGGPYQPVLGYTNGPVIFGLTKDYRKKRWSFADTENAQANAQQLRRSLPPDRQLEGAALLAKIGAAVEAKKWYQKNPAYNPHKW